MQIILYNVKYKKTDVKKNLVDGISYEGSLRYPTNLLNPIVRLDLTVPADNDNTKFITLDYTYAYIPIFNRYYFIQNKVLVSTSIIDIYLHIDVLHTYIGATNAILRNENVFVERSSDSQIYDLMYEDNRISFSNTHSISYYTPTNTDSDITFKDFTRTVADLMDIEDKKERNVLISFGSNSVEKVFSILWAVLGDETPVTNNSEDFNFIECGTFQGFIVYAFTYAQANWILCQALTNDTIASAIRSVLVLPFAIPSSNLINDNSSGIVHYLNDTLTLTALGHPNYFEIDLCKNIFSVKIFSGYLSDEDVSVSTFLDTGNHAKYELYIPYVGWVNIDANIIYRNQLVEIFYNINADNGDVSYVITIDGELYDTNKTLIGVNIAPNTSNAYENSKKEEAAQLQGVVSTITGAIMTLAGIATAAIGGSAAAIPGVGMMLGGVMSAAGGVTSAVTTGLQIVDVSSKGTSTSANGLYLYDEVILRITKQDTFQPLTGAWLNENGRPTKVNRQLKLLKGYAEIGKCDFSIGSTEEEKELIDLLSQGVHFPTTSGW